MNIYIDESGSFVSATHLDAWNIVAAYVLPENDVKKLHKIIAKLKVRCGKSYKDEIKLKDIPEKRYINFLAELNNLKGTLFCTATDSSLIDDNAIKIHRNIQADNIVKYREKMIHVEGKKMLDDLSGQIRKLSPQLYLQLTCQVNLLFDVIQRSTLFYAQRFPKTLRKFSWEIDQKNTTKIDFEDAFEKVTPPLLQSRSLREPFLAINEFDYSAMNDYFYSDEDAPTYLQEEYDLDVNTKGGLNIGKILWTDLKFKDSKMSIGVQTSDLLASGIRRSLRGQFTDNSKVSALLGKLMVESVKEKCPINLISFVDSNVDNTVTSDVINNFRQYSKPMLV